MNVATELRIVAALVAVEVACASPPAVETTEAELNGIEGMFDYALDIPWRMEPRPDGTYDPVPLTIAILDEDTNAYTPSQDRDNPHRLGELCSISVATVGSSGTPSSTVFHAPKELAWIEVTGPDPEDPTRPAYWPYDEPLRPWHRVCTPATEDCSDLFTLYGTSEWHAQLMLDLGSYGARTLELVAWVTQYPDTCEDTHRDQIALRNYARLHYASAPLPRFDDGWLYGDLHYHSQSTDNEGESGYAYRAVATTLAAMGVDFVYATDHASDSEQIVDLDDLGSGVEEVRGLRDLSQPRWDAAIEYLHAPGGANETGAAFAASHVRKPRVFLGAEVDVMPEVPSRPVDILANDPAWQVPYGNGLVYDLRSEKGLCEGWFTHTSPCPLVDFFASFVDVDGERAYVVSDVQGLNDHAPGRQHLVHLPRFRDQPQGFVGSRTSKYGGGSRHLLEGAGVLDEIAAKQGVAFLAHPLSWESNGKGPGMLPYTQYQYEKIFDHQNLVGLQLWNEDSRVASADGDFAQTGYAFFQPPPSGLTGYSGSLAPGFDFLRAFTFTPVASLSGWGWSERMSPASGLHHGTAQWDRLLRWGLDRIRTSRIPWLAPGEPRRMFMAGGSDAHGDFNYRRQGYMFGPDKTTDTAIAKVRNLVEVGAARGPCRAVDGKCDSIDPAQPGHSQDQVAEALAEGRFSVTDGPALRIVVDRNRNHAIDKDDYPMGATVELYNGEPLPLLVEALSSPEFGAIDRIDLYVGVDNDARSTCTATRCDHEPADVRQRTYAPTDHGVRGIHTDGVTGQRVHDTPADDCGFGPCQMADGYWLPRLDVRTSVRRAVTPPTTSPGVWELALDADQFPTGGLDPRPTRLYVRAFARTIAPCSDESPTGTFRLDCAPRYVYSNPIWALRRTLAPGEECPFTDRALDRDLDGVPDACDEFPDMATGGAWTRVFGGTGTDLATATAIDASNQVYVAGVVVGQARFEGGSVALGQYTAAGQDAVIAKYSPTGLLLARTAIGGTGTQIIHDVALEGSDLYVVGATTGSSMVGTWSWTSTSADPFVAKLRAGDLSVVWVQRLTGTGRGDARAVAVGGGVIAVAGDFGGVLAPHLNAYPAQGTSDCFVAFFDAASAGGTLRATQLASGDGTCLAEDIVVDAAGRSTGALTINGNLRVSTSLAHTAVGSDAAVVRYDNLAGGFAPRWATYLGGTTTAEPGNASARGLALGSSGSVVVAGSFDGAFVVEPTPSGRATTLATSAGGRDGHVLILDASGASASGPVIFSGTAHEELVSVGVDGAGRIAAVGAMSSATARLGSTALTRRSTTTDYVLAWIGPGRRNDVRQMTSTGLVAWRKLAAGADRVALAAQFYSSARLDDRRTVVSAGENDGAVVLVPQPPAFGTAP